MAAGRTCPLDGVRVIDLTQYVAGPYCTQVLADLGATVVKIERPGSGDVYRRQGPVFSNGVSASFLTLNRGKQSVELDITSAEDRDQLETLVGQADVLVENMRPGTLAKYELDFESLSSRHPRLIYCSISGFGQVGPMAADGGYDLTVQALSGVMSMTGHPGGPPAKVPVAALDFGSALYAVIGILAALRERDHHGAGQWVTTSILESSVAWLSMHITTLLLGGEPPSPLGTRSPFFAPYEAYSAADGHLVLVGTGGKQAWEDLCRALDRDDLLGDERFATNGDRVKNADDLKTEIERTLTLQTREYWHRRLSEVGVVHAPVQSLDELLEAEQLRALQMLESIEHPDAGPVPSIRLPITLSKSPTTSRDPAPTLGQHTESQRRNPWSTTTNHSEPS